VRRLGDVQLSQPIRTCDVGELIRALFTTSGAVVVLSPVGSESPVDSMVVPTTDDVDVMELSFGDIWKREWRCRRRQRHNIKSRAST
jgi:hypothetical protein